MINITQDWDINQALSLEYRVELLERPFALRILLALYRFGRTNRSVLYDMLESSPQTPLKRLEEMIELGLISEFKEERRKYVQLTEAGIRAAMAVDALETVLAKTED